MCCTGEGPFPGIITLYTLSGIVFEPQAALPANKGFVVFALALYGYQNIPKMMDKLDLEYFEEGLTFLHMHPKVSSIKKNVTDLIKQVLKECIHNLMNMLYNSVIQCK